MRVWGQSLQPLEAKGLKAERPALVDFYNFNKNNTFLATLMLKFLL